MAIDQKPIESIEHTPHAEPEELGTLRPVDRRTIELDKVPKSDTLTPLQHTNGVGMVGRENLLST
jgi:hypothetical protein